MTPARDLIKTMVNGFLAFVEKADIYAISDLQKRLAKFKQLTALFRNKIIRCEVGTYILFPQQVDNILHYFSFAYPYFKELIFAGNLPYLDEREDLLQNVRRACSQGKGNEGKFLSKELVKKIFAEYKRYCFKSRENGGKLERLKSAFRRTNLREHLRKSLGYTLPSSLAKELFQPIGEEFKKALFSTDYTEAQAIHTGYYKLLGAAHLAQKMTAFRAISQCTHRFVRFLEDIGALTFDRGKVLFEGGAELFYLARFKEEILLPAADANKSTGQEREEMFHWLRALVPLICAQLKKGNYDMLSLIHHVYRDQSQKGAVLVTNLANSEQTQEPQEQTSRKEVLRTYKVGLRAPESLLTAQNQVIRQIEVLQFLKKVKLRKLAAHLSGDFSGFKRYKQLGEKQSSASNRYKEVFNRFKTLDLKGLQRKLQHAKRGLSRLLEEKHEGLLTRDFTRNELPQFADPANPLPAEISLHEYQTLAHRSFKMVCRYLNDLAEKYVHYIPLDKEEFMRQTREKVQKAGKHISRSSLEAYPEMAVANLVGRYGNMDQIAFSHISAALEAYRDLEGKFSHVRRLFFPNTGQKTDYSKHRHTFLAYYSIPHHLKVYLSKAWKVESSWIRDLLVGWRRKMDPLMPFKFRIEPLTALFSKLADFCKQYAQNEEEIKVISILQKGHVLHLLHEFDFSSFFTKTARNAYRSVKENIPDYPRNLIRLIQSRTFDIPISEFLTAAEELKTDVKRVMANLKFNSRKYKNCKTFLKKIKLLRTCIQMPKFQKFLSHFLAGNRFTDSLVRIFRKVPIVKSSRISRLFTALRGIVSLTFARGYPTATVHLKSAFLPRSCLTRPFTSPHRKKEHLPATLLSPKYVIPRKAHPSQKGFLNNTDATTRLRQNKPIWVGIPIYSPNQKTSFSELVAGTRKSVRRKGLFWFRLLPSKKIVYCLTHGASLKSIRFNVPQGPTQKIVVDLILTASSRESFIHSARFLKAWDRQYGNLRLPKTEYLGSDFNRIGTNLVAVGTPAKSIHLASNASFMEQYQNAYKKLEHLRKVQIPRLQRKLAKGKKHIPRNERLIRQLTLLHRKRERVMKEAKRAALMVYLYAAYRTKAQYLAWDNSQGISTRGTRGVLATAITYMPKRLALFTEFTEWAHDLKSLGYLPEYKATEPVSPYTSRICGECFSKHQTPTRSLENTKDYNRKKCKQCGRTVDRHANAARVGALLLKHVH